MKKVILIFLSCVILTSCYYDKEEYLYGKKPCNDTISFKTQVQPLIMENCATKGCHGDDESPILSDFNSVDLNLNSIKQRIDNGTMPPFPKPSLTSDQIQTYSCWIEQGALNN